MTVAPGLTADMSITAEHREPIRFLVFSGSLRAQSLNTKLAHLAAKLIIAHGGQVDSASMSDFDGPSLNQDIEAESTFPP